MKNNILALVVLIVLFAPALSASDGKTLPHLMNKGTATQLIVNEAPFLIIGGELGNSSASDLSYLKEIWPKIVKLNLNTVLVPVYWELIEPIEGSFDFKLVDSIIYQARAYNLKLVILWFGIWKNSMSCYAPEWIKTNQQRFPRSRDKEGNALEILTPFNESNLNADISAFRNLMKHIAQIDNNDNTVIMVQIENEIGMIPDARDYEGSANIAFKKPVPHRFINYMEKNKNSLMPELFDLWKNSGFKTEGSWEEIFGISKATDELFMAWYYAIFVEEISREGKNEYNIPMFVNAALIREGYQPGQYPSAGPLPHLMDVWRAGAPSVDFLSPDIYFPDIKDWCRKYDQAGNPFFIPEARREPEAAMKAFYVFGNHNTMGFSPFSIESTDNPNADPIGKAYGIISQLAPILLKCQGQGKTAGVLLDHEITKEEIVLGGYKLIVKHDYTLGWSPKAKEEEWPLAGGLVICTAPGEYYIAGNGLVVTFETLDNDNSKAGIARIEEGKFIDGQWLPGLRMNGDQSHQGRHLRIPEGSYSIQKIVIYTYK